jgi:hypothetical protein
MKTAAAVQPWPGICVVQHLLQQQQKVQHAGLVAPRSSTCTNKYTAAHPL